MLRDIDTGAPSGTYAVMTAAEFVDGFAAVELPGPDWSWGTEDTGAVPTLFVTKELVSTPARETSWAELKTLVRPRVVHPSGDEFRSSDRKYGG